MLNLNLIYCFSLNQFNTRQGVLNALVVKRAGGRTNTQGALRMMHTEFFSSKKGDREKIPNIGVILTDGKSNVNPSKL